MNTTVIFTGIPKHLHWYIYNNIKQLSLRMILFYILVTKQLFTLRFLCPHFHTKPISSIYMEDMVTAFYPYSIINAFMQSIITIITDQKLVSHPLPNAVAFL